MKDGGRKILKYIKPLGTNPKYSTQSDSCDINVSVTLENIQDAMADAKVGDFLSIRDGGNNVLVAFNSQNKVCGEIKSPFNRQLIECISKGKKYRGRVTVSRDLNILMVK